ncbi:MAG: hypothetical protein BIFFINMI_01483 [Phycisphaerae bacterium]|nr:hypothetical protein [Phycisphaerae bacterium]
MNTWIAVPTYWTHPTTSPGPETTVFDHPTPLDEDGTLVRTLESFVGLNGEFQVIVVAAAAHASLGDAVHQKVRSLIAPLARRLSLVLASPANLDAINGRLPEPILALNSYGNIRNVQLAVPLAAGADVVVGIDDDELVQDADFLAKVERFIGRKFRGVTVAGMAGPYYDRAGNYQLPDGDALASEPNIFLKKNHFMNEALKRVMEPPCPEGLVRSNVAFGGNMCMSRDTIAAACHDPYIPRGEDYDYVLNAAMAGATFFFQPAMAILHLPPDSTGPQAADKPSKLIADIRRFIYMQEKVRRHRRDFPAEALDLARFKPYPAPYLDPEVDLHAAAVEAIRRKYPHLVGELSPKKLADDAVATARVKAAEFFNYRVKWRKATAALADDAGAPTVVDSFRVA